MELYKEVSWTREAESISPGYQEWPDKAGALPKGLEDYENEMKEKNEEFRTKDKNQREIIRKQREILK